MSAYFDNANLQRVPHTSEASIADIGKWAYNLEKVSPAFMFAPSGAPDSYDATAIYTSPDPPYHEKLHQRVVYVKRRHHALAPTGYIAVLVQYPKQQPDGSWTWPAMWLIVTDSYFMRPGTKSGAVYPQELKFALTADKFTDLASGLLTHAVLKKRWPDKDHRSLLVLDIMYTRAAMANGTHAFVLLDYEPQLVDVANVPIVKHESRFSVVPVCAPGVVIPYGQRHLFKFAKKVEVVAQFLGLYRSYDSADVRMLNPAALKLRGAENIVMEFRVDAGIKVRMRVDDTVRMFLATYKSFECGSYTRLSIRLSMAHWAVEHERKLILRPWKTTFNIRMFEPLITSMTAFTLPEAIHLDVSLVSWQQLVRPEQLVCTEQHSGTRRYSKQRRESQQQQAFSSGLQLTDVLDPLMAHTFDFHLPTKSITTMLMTSRFLMTKVLCCVRPRMPDVPCLSSVDYHLTPEQPLRREVFELAAKVVLFLASDQEGGDRYRSDGACMPKRMNALLTASFWSSGQTQCMSTALGRFGLTCTVSPPSDFNLQHELMDAVSGTQRLRPHILYDTSSYRQSPEGIRQMIAGTSFVQRMIWKSAMASANPALYDFKPLAELVQTDRLIGAGRPLDLAATTSGLFFPLTYTMLQHKCAEFMNKSSDEITALDVFSAARRVVKYGGHVTRYALPTIVRLMRTSYDTTHEYLRANNFMQDQAQYPDLAIPEFAAGPTGVFVRTAPDVVAPYATLKAPLKQQTFSVTLVVSNQPIKHGSIAFLTAPHFQAHPDLKPAGEEYHMSTHSGDRTLRTELNWLQASKVYENQREHYGEDGELKANCTLKCVWMTDLTRNTAISDNLERDSFFSMPIHFHSKVWDRLEMHASMMKGGGYEEDSQRWYHNYRDKNPLCGLVVKLDLLVDFQGIDGYAFSFKERNEHALSIHHGWALFAVHAAALGFTNVSSVYRDYSCAKSLGGVMNCVTPDVGRTPYYHAPRTYSLFMHLLDQVLDNHPKRVALGAEVELESETEDAPPWAQHLAAVMDAGINHLQNLAALVDAEIDNLQGALPAT